MDWLVHLNESLDYIESTLTETINLEKAAEIAQCSVYHYQRMFSYIAGASLGEYIRRRKMSLAGVDLQRSEKVINVALKYGYQSPTAFSKAFKTIHGITPQEAKAGGKLISYPKMTFSITVKGVAAMEYQITEKEAFKVVGVGVKLDKDMEKAQQRIPEFWQETASSGKLAALFPLLDKIPAVLGVSMMTAAEADDWEYVIGVASDERLEGFEIFEIPAGKWAVFKGTGEMPGSIQALQKQIFTEWLPTSGYEYAELPDLEVYYNQDPEQAEFEIWFPVK